MAREAVFPGATVLQFRNLFQPKREYREAIAEMGFKERLFDWKPTTELEKKFQAHLIDKALVKVGKGMLKITSYRLNDLENECSAYLSYWGKGLRMTAEGREGDVGFFLTATQTPQGLAIHVESKREHYKVRTWIVNILFIALGLVFAIIPGILFAAFCFFFETRLSDKKIERNIWPPLSALLEVRMMTAR
jgi:uncharacterized protein YneF (UPF0154 family)